MAGPRAQYTHWKQTVFYLDEVLMVNEGDVIEGTLRCKKNAKNPRDLDIEIDIKFEGEHQKVDRTQKYLLH
jgi:protein arginine N-methyltransferase 1